MMLGQENIAIEPLPIGSDGIWHDGGVIGRGDWASCIDPIGRIQIGRVFQLVHMRREGDPHQDEAIVGFLKLYERLIVGDQYAAHLRTITTCAGCDLIVRIVR